MKKYIFLLSLILSTTCNLQAQREQAIYVEGLGNGIFYSLNYDVRFGEQADKWGLRVGVAPYASVVTSNLQVNYLLGSYKHKLEVGVGMTVLTGFGDEKGNNQIAPNAALMYRLQPKAKGLLFRIGLAPIFIKADEDDMFSGLNKVFWFWPGMSLGYAF